MDSPHDNRRVSCEVFADAYMVDWNEMQQLEKDGVLRLEHGQQAWHHYVSHVVVLDQVRLETYIMRRSALSKLRAANV